jgi:transcription initiation factor TFIIIB Brf1 subunit/transcription initiation factor TFIIB
MQGVQGTWKSGRTRTAAYEEYSILGRCPECREGLVYAGEERTELTCSFCGIVVSRADYTREDGSTAPSVSKSEPLGSYIVADTESASSLKGPAFGWAKLMPNIVGRGGPMPTCSMLTNRIAERLALPKSIAQSADITARRLLIHRESYEATIPSISAYSLLYACRSAAIVHISHREVLKAYTDAGYRVRKSDLLKLGLESGMHLPHPSKDDFVRAAIGRLQSSERIAERLSKSEADPKEYFTTLFERSKELASSAAEPNGFNPRTVAAGSVYLASLAMRPKTFSQREAGESLGIKEYTVREYCSRRLNEEFVTPGGPQVRPVKCGPPLGGHVS